MTYTYKYTDGSLHDRFHKSRAKIQMFGGGFGNGKTSGAVIKTLQVARAYPGANILVARSTYPKLNDTIRKEFMKWCPKSWIKSFPMSTNASNTCTLTNGTTINFRYVQQHGKSSGEQTTSNLLSATYDLIVIDQIEDPEIVHKDLLDLLGRLRGMTPYQGDDETMPHTGPRWVIITCNPTRNWVYKKIVLPLHKYMRTGERTDDLIWDSDAKKPMVELYEGSTYENKDNLEPDFIQALEASYTGQMRARFLMGEWGAYEGLVYPLWNTITQFINHDDMVNWYTRQYHDFARTPSIVEGYDYGLAVPACYGFFFIDVDGNMHLMDGFYEKELPIDVQAKLINDIRDKYMKMAPFVRRRLVINADPSVFKRVASGKSNTVGESIAAIFSSDRDNPINMQPGNNNIANGIVKVTSFIKPRDGHKSPYDGNRPAPLLYVSDHCSWFDDEISAYAWKRDTTGDTVEKPIDKDDHAMDMIKFALSHRPAVPAIAPRKITIQAAMTRWMEHDEPQEYRTARHG